MSTCIVTGAAGFIGSHLSERLIRDGHSVVGLDAFIPYYDRSYKDRNLSALLKDPSFTFHEVDLREADIAPLIEGADVIFNEAAMPGLVKSWSQFDLYASCNQIAMLRLLEAAKAVECPHLIHVSTSSVYGKEATGPEDTPLRPFSPYGITKLAAEQLCFSFADNFGLPVTILRYFSVYGPRQRPDMAYHILIQKLLDGEEFPMFGDGEQTRSNTFVSDCVEATCLTFQNRDKVLGEVFNVGGGEIVSLNDTVRILEELTGKQANINRLPPRPGDQRHTAANIDKIKAALGYNPTTRVRDGLAAEVEWYRSIFG